jgi:Arc/MetJ-type ribon-helix-helix transcriptional regulator
MSAEPAETEDQTEPLREMVRLVQELNANMRVPAAWAHWTGMLAALQPMLHQQHAATEVAQLLASAEFQESTRRALEAIAALDPPTLKAVGAARKVSVSMPEDLTTAVQQRVGRGKFSQYVTEAVTRQLELDLLAELSEMLTAEHGPVPEGYLAEARAAWPDDE